MPTLSAAQENAVRELLRVSPVAADLGERVAAAGHALHLAGASVRDALLGRLGDRLELVTDADTAQVRALTAGWGEPAPDGPDDAVVLVRDGLTLAVRSYGATSLADDLAGRDLTVDAMAVALPDWRSPDALVDPHGGLDDLARHVLRTPRAPSFEEDPVRMLRIARSAAELGFAVDPDLAAALRAGSALLAGAPADAVREELSGLLLGTDPRAGLELLVDTGLADAVLPELPALRLEIDEHHQHKDVYEHTLQVLERAVRLEQDGPDLVLRLAALLHDVGKPRTRRHESGGGVSFHHHEVVGAKMARKRLRELAFDREVVDAVGLLTELHLRFHGYRPESGGAVSQAGQQAGQPAGQPAWTDSAVRRYVTDAGPELERLHKLVRSDCTTRNRRRAATLAAAYDDLEVRIAALAAKDAEARVRPDLSGEQVMELLGLEPGRTVGAALKHLLALRREHGPQPREQAEAALFAWAREQGLDVP